MSDDASREEFKRLFLDRHASKVRGWGRLLLLEEALDAAWAAAEAAGFERALATVEAQMDQGVFLSVAMRRVREAEAARRRDAAGEGR